MTSLLQALALSLPMLLAFLMRSKTTPIVLGTIWMWMIMVTACQYRLAAESTYDSIAPSIVLVAGWMPGLVYSLMCVLVAVVVKSLYRTFNKGRGTQAV